MQQERPLKNMEDISKVKNNKYSLQSKKITKQVFGTFVQEHYPREKGKVTIKN